MLWFIHTCEGKKHGLNVSSLIMFLGFSNYLHCMFAIKSTTCRRISLGKRSSQVQLRSQYVLSIIYINITNRFNYLILSSHVQ